jgi:hypothetical protein
VVNEDVKMMQRQLNVGRIERLEGLLQELEKSELVEWGKAICKPGTFVH